MTTGYTVTAVALHWATALLIASAFAIGPYMVSLEFSPIKLKLFSYHKWVGVTVFLLALLRMAWRVFHPPPALPDRMPPWERLAAKAAHLALYALMLAVPLTGWLMSSAHGFQTVYLGLLPLPDLLARDRALAEGIELVHYVLNKTLLITALMHAAAALKHHFIDRDDVLRRMLGLRNLMAALLVVSSLPGAVEAATAVREDSSIEFVSRQMGVPVRGAFKRFDAEVRFDPADPLRSRASITIDLDSVDAGSEEATVEIKRRPWFDVRNHPRAEFVSGSLSTLGPGRYLVTGEMTIKGRAREVSAPVSVRRGAGAWLFEGKFVLNRLQFGIGEGAWAGTGTVAAEVEVRFRLAVPYGEKDGKR